MALRGKQQRFVDEYLLDLNATQAAIRAGYSRKTAFIIGHENLKKPNVAAALAAAMQARAAATGVTQARVLQELAILDFSDPRHYQIDDQGNLTLAEGVPPAALRAVSSIKKKVRHVGLGEQAETIYETEIKFWDKVGALRLTAQHLGMLLEKRELSGPGGGPIPLEALTAEQRQARIAALDAKRGITHGTHP
jgi:phage terminase small subunit